MTLRLFRAAVLALPLTFAVASAVVFAEEKPAATQDPVAAIVNGDKIYQSDVLEARDRLPSQFHGMSLSSIYTVLLNSLIDRKLVAADARRHGILKDEDVKRMLAELEDRVLHRVYLERYVEEHMTEAALKAQREKLVAENRERVEIRARHIVVTTEAEAKKIIAELNDGADFATLAKEKSIGPSAQEGGNLGYFTKQKMVPEFAKAAFALDIGQISKTPIHTQYGWHVIKVEDRRAVPPIPADQLDRTARAILSKKIRADYLRNLRASATIERFKMKDLPKGETESGQGAVHNPHGGNIPRFNPHGKP